MPKEVPQSIKSLYDEYVQFFLDESGHIDMKIEIVRTAKKNKPPPPQPSFFQSLFPCLLNPRYLLAKPSLIAD